VIAREKWGGDEDVGVEQGGDERRQDGRPLAQGAAGEHHQQHVEQRVVGQERGVLDRQHEQGDDAADEENEQVGVERQGQHSGQILVHLTGTGIKNP